jgi:polyhydroxyalkanoate synthesis regulator phasin
MEELFSDEERSDPNYFPRFYFLLVPFRSQALNSGDQLSGIFNSLKGEIQKQTGSMEQKMEEKIESMEEKMEEKIGSANKSMEQKMEEKIGSMKEQIRSMEQKMEERMDRIDAMQAEFLSLLREMKK